MFLNRPNIFLNAGDDFGDASCFLALCGEGLRRDAKALVAERRDLPLILKCWKKGIRKM
jgi:hypothetical protein